MKNKILIIEDEEKIAQLYKDDLEYLYDVDIAYDGEKGWDLWTRNPYDLVLLDLNLPKIKGDMLLEKIKNHQPLSQIIIISAYDQNNRIQHALNYHAFYFLKKATFDTNELLNVVSEALKNRDTRLLSLEKMVETSNDPYEKELIINGESLSVLDIFNESRKGTEIGKIYLDNLQDTLINEWSVLNNKKL